MKLVCLPVSHHGRGADVDLVRKANVQDALTPSKGQQATADTLAVPVKALIDTTHIADAIHKGVDTFMEAAPSLMKALDEVGRLHPFINGASLSLRCNPTMLIV